MGKRERNEAEAMIKKNNQTTQGNSEQTQGMLWNKLPEQEQEARDTGGKIKEGYTSFMGGTGSYTPEAYNVNSEQNKKNIATGGYNDPEQLSQLKGHIARNVESGGYTPEELERMQTGGMDQGQAAKVRGGYDTLIGTGGLSDDAAGAMRRQAASSTASVYSTLGQRLAAGATRSGFGAAGGETAQMARQAASAGAEATTGANAEIGKLRQTGTIAGLGGLSQFEQGAATGNRQGMASVAEGRLKGTGMEADLAASQAKGTLQASGQQQDLDSKVAVQRMEAAGGLQKLYESSPGYVNDIVKQIIVSQQNGGQLTNEQSRIMQELSKQPGLYQNILQGIGVVGGAGAGVLTGIGGLSGGGKH